MRRRAVLAGLIAVACAPRRAITAGSPLPEALRLGWRLVPGQVLVYDTLTVHRQPGQVSRLRARWRYQVVAREQGIATLSGHLVGIGGQVKGEGDTITRLNAESPAPERTRLRLGTDGRIRPDAGADCGVVGMPSAACFGRHLTHRLLGLPLPDTAVHLGQSWRDGDLAGPFLALLPDTLSPEAEARCAVADIYRDPIGQPRVDLRSTLLVRTTDGPTVRADGDASWDPIRGTLARRRLEVRVGGIGPGAGSLTLSLTRLT